MQHRKATLIQDVREFLAVIRPYLHPLLETYSHYGLGEEDVLHWVLSEEIEIIYGLFDHSHQARRGDPVYQQIYSELQRALPRSLSVIVGYYIRVPALYDENIINLQLTFQDLYLRYYRDEFTTDLNTLRFA